MTDCACGATEAHNGPLDCIDRLLRDKEALTQLVERLYELRDGVGVRVEIGMTKNQQLVLYLATSRSASDETIAALIVSQLDAARVFGRLTQKTRGERAHND